VVRSCIRSRPPSLNTTRCSAGSARRECCSVARPFWSARETPMPLMFETQSADMCAAARLQGFAYLQGAWMHAGRISCPHHGNWLFSVRDKLGRQHCDPAHRAQYRVSSRALQGILDHQANLESSGAHRWIPDAGDRLKAFEAAVVAATAAYSPPTEQWGGAAPFR
jgi:hypothetical protein